MRINRNLKAMRAEAHAVRLGLAMRELVIMCKTERALAGVIEVLRAELNRRRWRRSARRVEQRVGR